ncbi:hypothetical protein [Streptomyces albipurpureus]|uniref:Uncharacterized protein n=1 Tax=Streptomyces albipurpureus TaxID=2897419 RepID=A0ABT0UFG9_9ACTN|nr:hypothetical protein [Streptomyces sp. CWNU-1]MCM2387372.1 hypothetical protein [Streptomyces sp. CWNU-1]
MTVEHLPGKLVVEVGERQAWPFLDTESDPERELRLYLDTDWLITPPGDAGAGAAGSPDSLLPELVRLNNRYVVTAVENARVAPSPDEPITTVHRRAPPLENSRHRGNEASIYYVTPTVTPPGERALRLLCGR